MQANIFVHFIPVDHDEENEKDREKAALLAPPSMAERMKKALAGLVAKKKNVGGHEQDNHDQVRNEYASICIAVRQLI